MTAIVDHSAQHSGELQILTIDTDYVRPGLAASYLLLKNGRGAFVDTGTTRSVSLLLRSLSDVGLSRDDVDYVFLTHVHLDHAGGAGALMQALPNAKCVVHPRGARHMADPGKLISGAVAVYGADKFQSLYGDIPPIAAERLVEVSDGQSLSFGGHELNFLHTPGHALHHYCIVDVEASVIFSGDTFGVSYRALDTARGAFIFPTTTPVQFDPLAAHASIDRLVAYRPTAIYPTHFGRVEGIERLATDLHSDIDAFVGIARRHVQADQRRLRIQEDIFEHLSARLDRHGYTGSSDLRHQLLDLDLDLNAQGLEVWLDKQG